MLYRSQKEFKHIIQQLNNVQNAIQEKILTETHPRFHYASEHPMIDFFRGRGCHITPTTSKCPDEIGYTRHHQLVGFELINAPHQLVPHWSLEQAIQHSQYDGQITHCVIITDGIFNHKDRKWARDMFSDVKLFDAYDLNQFSQSNNQSQIYRSANHNYTDQEQILQKIKSKIIRERKRQEINQQRATQLRQAIHKIQNFVPILDQFKNDFKKSAHQQNQRIRKLQNKFDRQRRHQKELLIKQQIKNSRIRLRAARNFSNEIMNLI